MMSQIQVDPSVLRDAARQLSEAAARLRDLGDQAIAAAEGGPSYDGQFGPKVQSMALDLEADIKARADRAQELSLHLEQIAANFTEADAASLAGFAGLFATIQDWLSQLGLGPQPVHEAEVSDPARALLTPTPHPALSSTDTPTPSPAALASAPLSLYWEGMSEDELASYQRHQGTRNDCAEFAIAAGLNLIMGTNLKGEDLAIMADEGAFIFPLAGLRMMPNGPTSPWQAANIVNEIALQENLQVRGRAVKASTQDLMDYIQRTDVIPVVTIAWNADEAPVISLGTEFSRARPSESLGAHAMLLVTYDSEHYDVAGNPKPWGFVNSWATGGQELYWMSDNDLNRTLEHPLLALSNTVLIEDITGLDNEVLAPLPSAVQTPDATPTPVPTSTPTPGEGR